MDLNVTGQLTEHSNVVDSRGTAFEGRSFAWMAARPAPFARFARLAIISLVLISAMIAAAVGMAKGDALTQTAAAVLATGGGLPAGLLTLHVLGRLIPESAYCSAATWKPIAASYVPYAFSGAVAAAIGMSIRGAIPPDIRPLGLIESISIISMFGLAWTLLGLIANRLQDRDDRILKQLIQLESEVAERRRTEDNLRSSQERLAIIFESAPDAYYLNDMQGNFVDGNKAAEELVGYPKEELMGKSFLEVGLLPQEEVPKAAELLARNAQGQPTSPDELTLRRSDGQRVVVEIRTYPVNIRDQHLVLGIARDITERKQWVEALQDSESRYRLLAEHVTDVIWIVNMDMQLTFVTPSVERLRGYTVEETLAQTPEEILTPASLKTAAQTLLEGLATEYQGDDDRFRSWTIDLEIKCKGGSTMWTETTLSFLRDADGSPVGILGLSRDITDRKKAEEQLKQALQELAQSNTELKRLGYIASHHLQEPLRQVVSYVQLLEKRYKGRLDADADEFIGYAVDGALRIQQLINDFLNYFRLGSQSKPFGPVNCEAALRLALDNLEASIAESQAVITHDPLPIVEGDSEQLTQLFENLVSNAIKFRRDEPPRIHVSADRVDDHWAFSVRDNGIGIDPQLSERIFMVFQRLHGPKYPGTGIGLAICRRIVENHRGHIWVESEPEKGAVFRFTLPAADAIDEA